MKESNSPHEDQSLKLDSAKARNLLRWRPLLTIEEAVTWTVQWYKRALSNTSPDELYEYTKEQIQKYQQRASSAYLQ